MLEKDKSNNDHPTTREYEQGGIIERRAKMREHIECELSSMVTGWGRGISKRPQGCRENIHPLGPMPPNGKPSARRIDGSSVNQLTKEAASDADEPTV